MAIHTYKKCPHCGRSYNWYSNHNKKYNTEIGCPFILCNHCGKLFVDKDIIEPALEPEEYENIKRPSIVACLLQFFFPFGLCGIFMTIAAVNGAPEAWGMAIPSYLLYVYLSFTLIRNRDRMVLNVHQEYNKSVERMKSFEYVQAVQGAGFDVPQKYLENASDRISFKEIMLSVLIEREQQKRKRKKHIDITSINITLIVRLLCIVSVVLVVLVMNIQDADRDRLESIPPSALYVFMLVANIVCVVLLSIMKKRTLRSKTKVVFYVIIITLCLAVGSFEFYDSSIWAVRNSSYLTYRTYLNSNFVTVLNHVICILNIVVVLAFALSKAVPYLKEHKLSIASYRSSIAYKEKCYAKVSKMYDYYQKGIISEEEYEKNKQEILKNIKN